MGGNYSRQMLSKKENGRPLSTTGSNQPSTMDLTNTAPSALARILLTSEMSHLDQLADDPDDPEVAKPRAPERIKSKSQSDSGVLHSRTMDEDWFRSVHHSILGHGGDLRTSALSLYLPNTDDVPTPTTRSSAVSVHQTGSNSSSPKDSGIDSMSTSAGSPQHPSPQRPGDRDALEQKGSSEVPPGERRLQRESSGLSSLGNRYYNSCWTIYVDSTVVKPNLESTLRCSAYVIVLEMEANHRAGRTTNEPMFETLQKPMDSSMPPVRTIPAIPKMEEVFTFLARIFKAAQLKADSAVIMLIYMHRMLNSTKVAMTSANWRRITVGALVMSSKVWEDQAIWNVDFCTLFPQMRVSEFNELERLYLTAMQFQVNVKASLYTRCYFLLRDVADLMKTPLTLQPLSSDEARKLELRMVQYRERVQREYGEVSDRSSDAGDFQGDLRRVKSDNIYVAKAGTSNAFLM